MKAVYFSPDHAAFRVAVQKFLAEQVLPFAQDWETQRAVPHDAWRAFGKCGLLGLMHPSEFGGQDRDIFYSVAFLEELGASGFAGVRASISVHAYMATHYLAKHGSVEIKRKYLQTAIAGETVAALAITEPQAGSDLSKLSTTARLDGEHFVVDGEKVLITNGINASFFVVAVRTTPPDGAVKRGNTGVSLLIVDAAAPGVSREAQEKIGWHSAGTAKIAFKNVRVPAANIIGRINSGFSYLMRGFQLERMVAAVLAVGGAACCIKTTLDYVKKRQAFGGNLAQLQTIRHRLADMATQLAGARALAYHAAWAYQADELAVTECSMAKLAATEMACRVADECLQLQGGQGYLADSPAARMFRDARAGAMAGGTTEIMRDIIAQQIIDMDGLTSN